MLTTQNKRLLGLHVVIFLWGLTGILGKVINLDFYHLVWNRLWIAVVGLAIYFVFKRHSLKVDRITLLKILGVGVLVAGHWLTFFASIQLSTASLGILCLSTTTLHITWLEPLLLKKKFSWTEFAMSLGIIVGIYIVTWDFDSSKYLALGVGLFSALLASLFAVSNNVLIKKTSSSTITFYEMLSGFVFISIIFLFQGRLDATLLEMTASDFYWLLFLGLICTSVSFIIATDALRHLGAFTVSLSINLEPIYTIIIAAVFLGEHEEVSDYFYIGAVIIIAIVMLNPLIKYRAKRRLNKSVS